MKKIRNWIVVIAVIVALIVIFYPFGDKESDKNKPVKYRTQSLPLPQEAGKEINQKPSFNGEKLQSEEKETPIKDLNEQNKQKSSALSQEFEQNQDPQLKNGPNNQDNPASNTQSGAQSSKLETGFSDLSENNLEAWVVKVGSFKDNQHAESLTEKLKNKQFRAFTKKVSTENGEIVQVFVGPEINKTLAEKIQSQLSQAESIQGVVVAYNPLKF